MWITDENYLHLIHLQVLNMDLGADILHILLLPHVPQAHLCGEKCPQPELLWYDPSQQHY